MVSIGAMLEPNGRRVSEGPGSRESPPTPPLTHTRAVDDDHSDTPIYCPSVSTVSVNYVNETSVNQREMCQTFCTICKVRFSLAMGQCVIGMVETVLGLYLQTHTPALRTRDTPYWAGVTLLLSGILNLYLCAVDLEQARSRKTTVLKITAVICSTATVFTCLIAAMFPAIFASRIRFSASCGTDSRKCTCSLMDGSEKVVYTYYSDQNDCQKISAELYISLVTLSTLCIAGSLSCLWFVILVWKSKFS